MGGFVSAYYHGVGWRSGHHLRLTCTKIAEPGIWVRGVLLLGWANDTALLMCAATCGARFLHIIGDGITASGFLFCHFSLSSVRLSGGELSISQRIQSFQESFVERRRGGYQQYLTKDMIPKLQGSIESNLSKFTIITHSTSCLLLSRDLFYLEVFGGDACLCPT